MAIPIDICGEVYEGHMCGGKSKLHFAECEGVIEMLPTVAGENETYIPDTFCVETKRIVIYEDGTMVFNELPEDRAANKAEYGSEIAFYNAYDAETNPYYGEVLVGRDTITDTEVVEQIIGIPWLDYASQVRTIVIGEEIAPISIDGWFANMENLTTVFGLDLFNLSNIRSAIAAFLNCSGFYAFSSSALSGTLNNLVYAGHMFDGCSGLQMVDVCGYEFYNLQKCQYMFKNCSSLLQIYAMDTFSNINDGAGMFYGCTSLVGGNGTAYDPTRIGSEMAVVDNGEQIGYLSECRTE